MRNIENALTAVTNTVVYVILGAGCATTPASAPYWHDLTGENRDDDDLRPDLAACNAVYAAAFDEAQRDLPADPTPGPSSALMAAQTIATVNLWKSNATTAFTRCMRANNWQLARD